MSEQEAKVEVDSSSSSKSAPAAAPVSLSAPATGPVAASAGPVAAPSETSAPSETPTSDQPAPATAIDAVAAPSPSTGAPAAIPTSALEAPTTTAVPTGDASSSSGSKKDATAVPELTPIAQLWSAAKAVGHPEVWGVTLADPDTHVPSQIVLQKYLNANDGDLAKAKDQLVKTLEWRAKTKPLDLVKKVYSKAKFEGLGFVTTYRDDAASTEPEGKEVFTWNVYGGAKSIDETFGNLNEFIEWRVALMELALEELSLSTATKAITADYDPYKIFQVHDYKSISFLRQSPHVKSASSETIKVFAQNYPELLKEKFFVNVPAIMGFVYAFMKLFVAPKTIKKFHPMSNGGNLALEFADSKVKALGEKLPVEYGGKGGDLNAEGREPELK
ncbi:CRAL-TRIO domain-containing protein [Bombardia bombarda]|uniref:Phosphatidylinositol transfer protein SFH5 n=1 Tax=Bombardia bombarda TaxID=252184 RepID=A0AA39X1E0_9PEZI|nr:CRAL-TRIO domain-containing protein [Bombardia bombarda]